MTELRPLDFIVIGAMKAGTTTLRMWLREQPEIVVPAGEPRLLASELEWEDRAEDHRRLFGGAGTDQMIGDESSAYTSPDRGPIAAARAARVVPNARLIYLVRDPVERLRSHYRHEVQRGRERRTLADACARPGNAYVPNSLYRKRLAPYIDFFPRESICVVRFEDLVAGEVGWSQILGHLGLPLRPPPGVAYNVTEDKPQYTRTMLWLWERGLVSKAEARPLPSWLRRLGRSILTRSGQGYREQLERSLAPLPVGVTAPLWEDAAGLQGWLGLTQPLWGGAQRGLTFRAKSFPYRFGAYNRS